MTILLLLIGAVIGFVAFPIVNTIFGCDCDYELLFNRCIDNLPIGCRYSLSEWESRKGYKIDRSEVYVTYKKCRKCGRVKVSVSNGTTREFHYDAEHVRNIIEAKMKNERDAEERALLSRADMRLNGASDTMEKLERLHEKVGA